MTRHTPEPWHVDPIRKSCHPWCSYQEVCAGPQGGNRYVVADVYKPADAKLIARAPAMKNALEALRTLLKYQDNPHMAEVFEATVKAIVDNALSDNFVAVTPAPRPEEAQLVARVARMRRALKEIADGPHSNTCKGAPDPGQVCGCHVGTAKLALFDQARLSNSPATPPRE